MPTAVKMEAETAAKIVAGLENGIKSVSFEEVLMVRLVRPANPNPADMISKALNTHTGNNIKQKCSTKGVGIQSTGYSATEYIFIAIRLSRKVDWTKIGVNSLHARVCV